MTLSWLAIQTSAVLPVIDTTGRILSRTRRLLRSFRDYVQLPEQARRERRRDGSGLPGGDPGPDQAAAETAAWIARAQDRSASSDGGVAAYFSLVEGWSASYPETTGYIVPTLLDYGRWFTDGSARQRGRRMLDWLVSVQLPEGGYQGGLIDQEPVVPVSFNTGQILLGLAAGTSEFGRRYRKSMVRAADWLIQIQDPDGAWRSHPSPFAAPGEKVYETHAAWGLLEAARVQPDRGYAPAALKNVDWALGFQREDGWLANCCLNDPARPLTHTLGYALRGIVEAYRFSGEAYYLDAARKTADGLLSAVREDGSLPGRLDDRWRPAVAWSCLTGNAQVAVCWLLLYRGTGDERYRKAAFAANRYVRRTIRTQGAPEDIRGAVKGSFPISGDYGSYRYLNWAGKFTIDANLLELETRAAILQRRVARRRAARHAPPASARSSVRYAPDGVPGSTS